MKLYLAASFSRQQEMLAIAAELTGLGHHVTSRWLFEEQGMKHGNCRRKYMMRCAFTDLEDVRAADMIVRFSDDLMPISIPSHLATGARHFETGYAFALGKPIIVVGGHQNVFDFISSVVHLKDARELINYLNPEEIN